MGERREVCRWGYMDWPESDSDFEGDCGVAWSMTHGGLVENGVNFCPRCGGAIEFIAPEPEPENDTGYLSADCLVSEWRRAAAAIEHRRSLMEYYTTGQQRSGNATD